MKDYLLKKNELGSVFIQPQAIEQIIKEEITHVAGVYESERNPVLQFVSRFTRKVKINQEDDGYQLSVPIKVVYGTNIPAVAHSVQERLSYTLKSMLGIENLEIDVFIDQIVIPK